MRVNSRTLYSVLVSFLFLCVKAVTTYCGCCLLCYRRDSLEGVVVLLCVYVYFREMLRGLDCKKQRAEGSLLSVEQEFGS